jgi:hypothetical protein
VCGLCFLFLVFLRPRCFSSSNFGLRPGFFLLFVSESLDDVDVDEDGDDEDSERDKDEEVDDDELDDGDFICVFLSLLSL